jgi:serine protease AprX
MNTRWTRLSRQSRPAFFLFVAICACTLGLRGAHAQHRAHLSADLLTHESRQTTTRARIIVHGTPSDVVAIAIKHHLAVLSTLTDGVVIAANSRELTDLAAETGLTQLSGDVRVRPWMSVSNVSTAADQVRAGQPGLLGLLSVAPVTGAGVTVAVVDSGISPHPALAKKVLANVSLVTGDPSVADAFGHGTHVAGIIAGLGSAAAGVTPLYTGGIASGAQLVNVRVLGADGSGLTSDVIAGIDWVIANKSKYNIRIVNLSLGHPVYESCSTDPLCLEVGKAVNAGLVVIAAAGNYGRNADGRMVLGSIASPGNSPYAITVGAINTWGTGKRSDDTVATFSSRGPTAIDFAVKPDIAAPGVKIVSLQAEGSFLASSYSSIHVAGGSSNAYMYLSGTSMSTPIVSGGVALLLQGAPGLKPAQVKLALQNGASYMTDGGLMGAGAGSVNFMASRKITATGLTSLLTTTINGLTGTSSGASFWDAGTMGSRLYAGSGIRLLSTLLAPLAWLDPSLLHWGDLNLLGLTNPLARLTPKWLQYGALAAGTNDQQILWGTTVYEPSGQQILWGTDTTGDQQILWGTSLTDPDAQ